MTEPATHLRDHVEIIARHEQESLARRTRSERLGDALGSFIGSLTFVSIHLCWFAGWIAFNTLGPGTRRFDRSPFPMLDTMVAIEAIFLASFIVMRQSRTGRRSGERDQLILQILMMTEKEITAVLSVERQLAARLGLAEIAKNAEIEQLSQHTSIQEMAETLQQHLAEE